MEDEQETPKTEGPVWVALQTDAHNRGTKGPGKFANACRLEVPVGSLLCQNFSSSLLLQALVCFFFLLFLGLLSLFSLASCLR